MTDVITEANVTEEPMQETQAPTEPTLEELKAKLKAYEDKESKSKEAISKACADAAEWKRKYRETLDDATREKQEQADRVADMETKLKAYEAKDRINNYTQKLVLAGYPIEQASRMAEGLPEGVSDAFFDEQRAFLEATKQTIKNDKLNAQPALPVGMPPSASDIPDKDTDQLRRWMGLK